LALEIFYNRKIRVSRYKYISNTVPKAGIIKSSYSFNSPKVQQLSKFFPEQNTTVTDRSRSTIQE
jgi:hypothetical protein